MATYVGLDLGSSMIKAATVPGPGQFPVPLRLANHDAYFPAAVAVPPPGQAVRFGWEAFTNRRLFGGEVATHFRDRLIDPSSGLNLGGRLVDASGLQASMLTGLGQAVYQKSGPDVKGLAVSIPDTWSAPAWSLPQAMDRCGWTPSVFVRESAAVLSFLGEVDCDEMLLLSMGASSLRASLCIADHHHWRIVETKTASTVSGLSVRKRLIEMLAEQVILTTRRDPREDAQADQQLHDSIENVLFLLQREDQATVELNAFDRVVARTFSRGDLTRIFVGFQATLEDIVESLLTNSQLSRAKCPIVAWGELVRLLPIPTWLERFCPYGRRVVPAPLDAVALGCAKLCAALGDFHPTSFADSFGRVILATGSYEPRWRSSNDDRVVPVWERIPTRLASPLHRVAPQLIFESSDGMSQTIDLAEMPSIRIGRHELAEFRFESHAYPMVSDVHAVLIREGTEFLLKDLNSQNGTFINGERIKVQPLQADDEIQLGQTGPRILFKIPD